MPETTDPTFYRSPAAAIAAPPESLAYVAAFGWALERGYDVVVEMDADGSHQPEQLPRVLAALWEVAPGDDAAGAFAGEPAGRAAVVPPALVIGSRWVPGGSVVNWPVHREALSRGGNLYVRVLLGVAVRDATAGFRVFHRATLEKIALDEVRSTGYVFQTDLVARTLRAGLVVREVPIEFVERVRGESKMTGAVAVESLKKITAWGVRERWAQLGRSLGRTR